ncbi:MAG: hypothetical protein ACREEW_06205 [Caulobacteraceae bacterium]
MTGAAASGRRRARKPDDPVFASAEAAVLTERWRAHESRDDDRFGALAASLDEVKDDVRALAGKVEAVGADVGEIKGRLAVAWRLGARAWTLISAAGLLAVSLIAWLGAQVYDLQPARIEAAQTAPFAGPVQSPKPTLRPR